MGPIWLATPKIAWYHRSGKANIFKNRKDADSHPLQNEERVESLKMLQFRVLDTAFAENNLYVMQDDCGFDT